MEDHKVFATRLINDVFSLPEEKMRQRLLANRFAGLAPVEIARVVDIIYNFGPTNPRARVTQAILVNPDVLTAALGDEKFRLVYRAALELGLDKISRLFTDLPPHRVGPHGYDKEEEAKMEFITLGERRAMARQNTKDNLDRLLSDPDPVVINNLLNNPRLIENDVLKIASKRPNSPVILKLLATHRRWSKRYNVMKSLVSNPYTPTRIATGLLQFLLLQDLKLIASDQSIHPQVIMGAKEILAQRLGRDEGEEDKGS